jgi:hypothetical protein
LGGCVLNEKILYRVLFAPANVRQALGVSQIFSIFPIKPAIPTNFEVIGRSSISTD